LSDERVRGVDAFAPIIGAAARAHGAVVRFGPVLHSTFVTPQGEVRRFPPEDSWAELARHQHTMYLAASGTDPRPARRPWGEPWTDPEERLPEFIREDNVRQLRALLTGLPNLETGLIWVPYDGTPGDALNASEIDVLAESEHFRWVALRLQNGWRGLPGDAPADETPAARRSRLSREDAERRNANLREWDSGVPLNQRGVPIRAAASDADRRARDRLQAWNRRQIETALLNLAA